MIEKMRQELGKVQESVDGGGIQGRQGEREYLPRQDVGGHQQMGGAQVGVTVKDEASSGNIKPTTIVSHGRKLKSCQWPPEWQTDDA